MSDGACEDYVSANHGGGGSAANTFTSCPASYNLRSIRIYSPDRGVLTVTDNSDGSTYAVSHTSATYNKTGGNLHFIYTPPCPAPARVTDCANYVRPHGYTFIAKAGANITISIPNVLTAEDPQSDLFTMEYSETHLDETAVNVTVTGDPAFAAANVVVSSKHDRRWITPFGAIVPQSGAWWSQSETETEDEGEGEGRRRWSTKSGIAEYRAAWDHYIRRNSLPDGACEPDSCDNTNVPAGSVVFDRGCLEGGVGCKIGGNACCRLCGTEGYDPC